MTSHSPANEDARSPSTSEAHEYASPPCAWHQADPSYYGFLTNDELTELLNGLLEGERAGARGLKEMACYLTDPVLKELIESIARDEARCCAMLTRHLMDLGAKPSRNVGRFCRRLQTRVTTQEKLNLLDRGQQHVVQTLDRSLAKIKDRALHADLKKMRDLHLRNIERAAEYTNRATS